MRIAYFLRPKSKPEDWQPSSRPTRNPLELFLRVSPEPSNMSTFQWMEKGNIEGFEKCARLDSKGKERDRDGKPVRDRKVNPQENCDCLKQEKEFLVKAMAFGRRDIVRLLPIYWDENNQPQYLCERTTELGKQPYIILEPLFASLEEWIKPENQLIPTRSLLGQVNLQLLRAVRRVGMRPQNPNLFAFLGLSDNFVFTKGTGDIHKGIDVELALQILQLLTAMLNFIHTKMEIVHLDIKSSNFGTRLPLIAGLRLYPGDFVLFDFGIVKVIGDECGNRGSSQWLDIERLMARVNRREMPVATPHMDTYALALIFRWLLTGNKPVDIKPDPYGQFKFTEKDRQNREAFFVDPWTLSLQTDVVPEIRKEIAYKLEEIFKGGIAQNKPEYLSPKEMSEKARQLEQKIKNSYQWLLRLENALKWATAVMLLTFIPTIYSLVAANPSASEKQVEQSNSEDTSLNRSTETPLLTVTQQPTNEPTFIPTSTPAVTPTSG